MSAELDDVVHTLTGLDPADADQRGLRDRMVEFATAHPDALVRTCPEGHFTASALVVDDGLERVLLLFHTKLHRWLQPGGHVDGSGDLAASASREAAEETGIVDLDVLVPAVDLDIHEVRPPADAPHLHLDVRFVAVAPPGAEAVGNHESTALRWARPDELESLGADPGLRRLAARGLDLARQRWRR